MTLFLAQASPSAPLVNALGWIDQTVMQLVTTKSDIFLKFGWEEFILFAGFASTFFLIRTALAGRHHTLFDLEGATLLLSRILFTAIFLTSYSTLHQLPMLISHGLSEVLTQGQLDPLFLKIADIQNNIQKPSIYDLIDITVYFLTMGLMGLVALVLFALNACNYVFLGLLSLFGPLAIPFFLTTHFNKWFFNWVNLIVSVSFMGVSIAGFTYVWTFFFMTCFENTIGNDYSSAHFLLLTATLPPLVGGFIYSGWRLSSFNAELFAGTGAMGANAATSVTNAVRSLIRMV